MDYASMISYFAAVAALTAAPGPLMAVLVVRSLGRDSTGAAAFAAGLCAGDVLAVCAVALGIGVWAQGMPQVMSLAKYVGVAYLLWLAVGMWNGRSGFTSAQRQKGSWLASVGAGMAICLGNPSTLLIYMLLLPGIAPSGFTSFGQMALVVMVTFTAVGSVFFGTILFALQLNKIIAARESSIMFGRISAAVIALTSVCVLAV
jgi:threonine/homoserine/homoserine lactone efflux protein